MTLGRNLMVSIMFALPVSAQGFAGTISAKFLPDLVPEQSFTWSVQDERWQLEISDGKAEVVTFRVLFDRSGRTLREASYVRGRLSATSPITLPPVTAKATVPTSLKASAGKPQKVAGMSCETYAFEVDGRPLEGCFTRELGRFVAYPLLRPVKLNPGNDDLWSLGFPDWALALNESELFPLKIWAGEGKVLMEVKKIAKGKFPFCFLELPKGLPGSSLPGALPVTSGGSGGRGVIVGRGGSSGGAPISIGQLIGAPKATNSQLCPQLLKN